VTLALWCIVIAGLLPYVSALIAKTEKSFDNADPRGWRPDKLVIGNAPMPHNTPV
jgi:uncharacterized MAPEG superfamily protein